MKKGNGALQVIAVLAVLIVLFVSRLGDKLDSGESKVNSQDDTGIKTQNISTSKSSSTSNTPNISLTTGNASRAYQSFEEYISIDNRGKEPVTITNWYLKNGKDKRAYNLGGQLKYFASDIATIGRAALFISPSGYNVLHNIVLEPGEKAIITTGRMGAQTPYKIVSFKENICSGYLENLEEYKFTPALKRNCPQPENELGVSSLDTECRKFIEKMPSCQKPEFDTRDRDGEICRNCVNGKPLSSACVTFIKSHYSYDACIANHVNDENFYGKTWRIFLGHGWEMWAKEYETIELFDQYGQLVKSRTY
ncbi:MAG: hypothetical protein AAB719_02310 [Patescibacteria group bacterium]